MIKITLIVNIVISLSFLLSGFYLKFQVKTNDTSIGFKTKRAMSSEENWLFANKLCGKLWIIIGAISFILSIIVPLCFNSVLSEKAELIVIVKILLLQIFMICLSIFYVEKRLTIYDKNNSQ